MYFNKRKKDIYANRLFQNVSSSDLRLNFSSKYFKNPKEGEIIYLAGDESDSLFLILSGQVKLKFYGIGNELTVIEKFENDFFGENELLIEVPRKSIAMAAADCLLFQIKGKYLRNLRKNSTIRLNLSGAESVNHTISRMPERDLEVKSETEIKKAEYSKQMNNSTRSFTDKLKDKNAEPFSEEEPAHRFKSEEREKPHIEKHDKQTDDELNKFGSEISDIDGDETISLIPEVEAGTSTPNKENLKLDDEVTTDETLESVDLTKTDDYKKPFVERLTAKEYHELSKKIIALIYDEIKMPLGLIKKYADILILNSSSVEANKVLQNILAQSNIIQDSFQNYTDFFNERIKIKTQPVLAENVLTDVLLQIANYTEFHGIRLFRKFEADAPIFLDKNLFYEAALQIVKFLSENIPGDGNIFVTVGRTSKFLIMEFKSNGPKFSDELLKKISEHFMLKEAPGLEFARKVIREHNATISIENSENEEPVVKIHLPVVK